MNINPSSPGNKENITPASSQNKIGEKEEDLSESKVKKLAKVFEDKEKSNSPESLQSSTSTLRPKKMSPQKEGEKEMKVDTGYSDVSGLIPKKEGPRALHMTLGEDGTMAVRKRPPQKEKEDKVQEDFKGLEASREKNEAAAVKQDDYASFNDLKKDLTSFKRASKKEEKEKEVSPEVKRREREFIPQGSLREDYTSLAVVKEALLHPKTLDESRENKEASAFKQDYSSFNDLKKELNAPKISSSEELEIREVSSQEKIPKNYKLAKGKELKQIKDSQEKELSDSFDMPAKDYMRKKSTERIKKEGISASGKRLVLHRSGTNQYFVEEKDVINEGTVKIIKRATLVDQDTGVVEPGHVIGRPKKQDDDSVRKEFQREKAAATQLRTTFEGREELLDEFILIPEATKLYGNIGANASKLAGSNLNDFISQLSVQDKLGVGVRVGTSLNFFHEAGVLHLDVKPDNIMVLVDEEGKPQRDKEGRLKFIISDLGTCYVRSSNNFTTEKFKAEYTDPQLNTGEGLMQAIEDNWPLELDNYMFGLTLLNLFSGQTMKEFEAMQKDEAIILDSDNPVDRLLKIYEWKMNPEMWGAWDLLESNLAANCPNEEVAAKIKDLIKSLLDVKPQNKPATLEEATAILEDLYQELSKEKLK